MTGACKTHWRCRKHMHNCWKHWKGANHLERPRHRWEDIIKMNLNERVLEVMERICLAVYQCHAFMNTEMNLYIWSKMVFSWVAWCLWAAQGLRVDVLYEMCTWVFWAAEIGHYFTNSAEAGACTPSINRGLQVGTALKFQVPEGWPEVNSYWRPTNLRHYLT
jgi:hypothetical protein